MRLKYPLKCKTLNAMASYQPKLNKHSNSSHGHSQHIHPHMPRTFSKMEYFQVALLMKATLIESLKMKPNLKLTLMLPTLTRKKGRMMKMNLRESSALSHQANLLRWNLMKLRISWSTINWKRLFPKCRSCTWPVLSSWKRRRKMTS